MGDRLVSFTVEHPQLEWAPFEGRLGRRKAEIWKNQGSPGLLLGSIDIVSANCTPLRSSISPIRNQSPIERSSATKSLISDKNIEDLLSKFPVYTKSHPKYVPSSPMVDAIFSQRRLGGIGNRIIQNRNKL